MSQDKQPLYIQVAEEMRNNIRTDKWLPNTKIPTEYDLCDIYHVSRITIRKAIDELVRDNLLEKKKPVGTFVKSIDAEPYKNYTLVKSFTMEMKEIGLNVETLKVNVIVSHADPHIAKYLNIKPGDKIIILKRLRGVENNGFAFFKTYLKFEEYYSLKSSDYYGSLYQYLNSLNIYMVDDKEIVESILPNKEIALWLKISSSTPVLKRLRFTSSTDKMHHEYTECYYIGSEYKYFIDFSKINH
ncbi:GntR family transcriptional regulator [Vagococcus carniphilus]|uniref:GntR family transcriptional regulator n=1 Tax=Vagococcus carniphilus TaxID=218144 RepID=A0AAW8U388_9ENTE|nr:GntR family transcriptional regulator [Vagococcus carniphilus]MDT2833534.1 GntR family transcriptional regulator [Vagococcus carniphilus]MDT2848668.1 GntR family transcriptional regulator [Vagococcus carniphilus]